MILIQFNFSKTDAIDTDTVLELVSLKKMQFMKRILSLFLVILAMNLSAQVDNYCLKLDASGSVDAGYITDINYDYSIQLWVNPDLWTPNAALFTKGSGNQLVELALGTNSGQLIFKAGEETLTINSVSIATGKWAQITLIRQTNQISVYVNNTLIVSNTIISNTQPSTSKLVIGRNFTGRIDEFRIWSTSLDTDYALWRNTLNKFHPQWDKLALYYKFDQNLCPNVVDYTYKHHGLFSQTGAIREKVTDNNAFKYRLHSAYTDFSRFADRLIDHDKYLLSNDIIILGVESDNTGTITMPFPDNQATFQHATHLSSYEGRNGVMAFTGAGSQMEVGTKSLIPTGKYSLHTWIYLDEWTEGAYIFKKETTTNQGFSIRLGNEATYQLIVRLNGQEFKRNIPQSQIAKPVGSWWNLGVVAFSLDLGVTKTFMFSFNGKGYFPLAADVPSTTPSTLVPQQNEQISALVGLNLKGKLDETVIWHTDLTETQLKSYMTSLPMPGMGKVVEAASVLQKMNSFWNYDNAANPGYDSYSYTHFTSIMRNEFAGYRGYTIRMSVKGHDNWPATFADAAKRQKLAQGIVEAAQHFDGIDLDFEWCYDGTCFSNYGLLIEEIGRLLPAEKIFSVSPHYVSYRLPLNIMQYVDYFNFQIYGPSANVFTWPVYVDAYNRFISYGYPKEKIVMSYASTTSKAYEDAEGNIALTAAPIGVINGLLDGNYTPDMDVVKDSNGKYRFITGVNQTRQRSEFVHDYDLAGIMYWDMGNDVATSHPYSIPKASNFALASNVDSIVTRVEINTPNGNTNPNASKKKLTLYTNNTNSTILVQLNNNESIDSIRIYTVSGQLIHTASSKSNRLEISTSTFPKGMYMVRVHTNHSEILASSFVK